jgi:glucose/arabinose dehydrogenase
MSFITSGDRMRFDPAQDLSSNLGKVVRINRDGSVPKDNPFAGKPNARGDIWSLGHRNILAAAIHPSTGQLWAFEMGPLGGDELNIVEPGKNYGCWRSLVKRARSSDARWEQGRQRREGGHAEAHS